MWLWVACVSVVSLLLILFIKRKGRKIEEKIQHRRTQPTKIETKRTGKKYLVTGGHGFLGSHIVEGLLARGETDIRILDLSPSHLFKEEEENSENQKIRFYRGSVLDKKLLREVCTGVDTVVHTAAIINYWERLPFQYQKFYDINVQGTQNLIEACQEAGVKQFIHASSATVAYHHHGRSRPIHGADETLPLNDDYVSHYCHTKRLAEKVVTSGNGKGGLLTACVRPGLVFGPRDAMASSVFLKPGLKFGIPCKQDTIYVENIVHAMFCIESRLLPNTDVGGQIYHLSNGPPISILEFSQRMAEHFGDKVATLPYWLMITMAYFSEFVARISKDTIRLGELSHLTPASLYQAGAFYFSDKKAQKEIGYHPIYSLEEGIQKSADYIKQFRN